MNYKFKVEIKHITVTNIHTHIDIQSWMIGLIQTCRDVGPLLAPTQMPLYCPLNLLYSKLRERDAKLS